MLQIILGTFLILGFLLFGLMWAYRGYKALVRRNGVQYEGFNAEDMPSIFDEALDSFLNEKDLGEL
jgi:hypothetical protein